MRFSGEKNPLDASEVQAACDQATEAMAGRGRVLLRKSGTEPLIRVMVEGEDEQLVQQYAEQIAQVVETVCS